MVPITSPHPSAQPSLEKQCVPISVGCSLLAARLCLSSLDWFGAPRSVCSPFQIVQYPHSSLWLVGTHMNL